MKKYTFITDYKGGTFISQYVSANMQEALIVWGEKLDILSNRNKKLLLKEINDDSCCPVAIKGIDNVWCSSYISGKRLIIVNIIETV